MKGAFTIVARKPTLGAKAVNAEREHQRTNQQTEEAPPAR